MWDYRRVKTWPRSWSINFHPGVVRSAAMSLPNDRRHKVTRLRPWNGHVGPASAKVSTVAMSCHCRRHLWYHRAESLPTPVPHLLAATVLSSFAPRQPDARQPSECLARQRRPSALRPRAHRAISGRRIWLGDLPPGTIHALSHILPAFASLSSWSRRI